jgi:putative DNA primase/helicase
MTNVAARIATHLGVSTEAVSVRLTPIDIYDLWMMAIPDREVILSPWLAKSDLCMVYAKRGRGKTHFALNVAYAIATGGAYLGWDATRPHKVLYVDGEMKMTDLKRRTVGMRDARSARPEPGFFRFIAADYEREGIPDLSTTAGQQAIRQQLGDAEVIVFDNLATLVRSGKENDQDGWIPVQNFLLELRRMGIAVLLVHHSGKDETKQRGTSAREDILDISIELGTPADRNSDAMFTVNFRKSRSIAERDLPSFDAHFDQQTGAWRRMASSAQARNAQIVAMASSGVKQKDIADLFGLGAPAVSKIIKAAKDGPQTPSQPANGNEPSANDEYPF